jgi:hypothetical protein
MSHFAQIDENGVVLQVLVIDQAEIDTGNWGDPTKWIQTSYNTRGGVYHTPETNEPDLDQSKAFRKNFAGIGCIWDGVGFAPPKPAEYPSWIFNSSSYLWEPPVPKPVVDRTKPHPPYYEWDEATLSWVNLAANADGRKAEPIPVAEI